MEAFLLIIVIVTIFWIIIRAAKGRQTNSVEISIQMSSPNYKPKPKKKKPIIKESVCPYCFFEFETPPKKSRKCPECKQSIKVSKRDGGLLLFTNESWIAEKKRRKATSFKKKWLGTLEYFGVSEADFDQHKKIFSDKNGFKQSDADTFWGFFNATIIQLGKRRDYHDLKMLNFHMARFLYEEGKDHIRCAKKAAKMELMHYKSDGVTKRVEILSGSCPECKKLEGQSFTISEALEKMPIPCESCQNQPSAAGRGWCVCSYVSGDFD